MPEPEYQRELGCRELSTRTAITFVAGPYRRWGVRSYWNELYPYGRVPSDSPLIQTSLLRYTPSNSMNTSRPESRGETANVLRYQPMPPGSAPPPAPAGFVSLNAPSMLQSCGTSSVRQPESRNVPSWAPETSPRWNRQSRSKSRIARCLSRPPHHWKRGGGGSTDHYHPRK